MSNDYFIPGQNLVGMHTYKIYNMMLNDTVHFEKVYGNAEVVILKVK
jgi:hypothetical protein